MREGCPTEDIHQALDQSRSDIKMNLISLHDHEADILAFVQKRFNRDPAFVHLITAVDSSDAQSKRKLRV